MVTTDLFFFFGKGYNTFVYFSDDGQAQNADPTVRWRIRITPTKIREVRDSSSSKVWSQMLHLVMPPTILLRVFISVRFGRKFYLYVFVRPANVHISVQPCHLD